MSDAPDFETLLSEHDYIAWDADFWECACGWRSAEPEFYEPDQHRVHLASVLEAHTADRERAVLRTESLLGCLPTDPKGGTNLGPGGTAVSQDIDSKLDGFAGGFGDVSEVGEVVDGEVVVAHSPPEAEELAVEFLSVGGGCSVGCHASSVLDVNPLCQEVLTHRERAAAEKALRDAASALRDGEWRAWEFAKSDPAQWLDDRADTYRRTDKEVDRG